MTVTFDAASTLIEVRWEPVSFALSLARELGLELDEGEAGAVYEHLLRTRWGHYRQLNLTRDPVICDQWWSDLTHEWLVRTRQDPTPTQALTDLARERLYAPGTTVFSLYDDTLPCLEALKAAGHQLAILSNWDTSLHRVVKTLAIEHYFDAVIASLEEGAEKPDPELFRIALGRLGASKETTVHVGDNPLDDLRGAQEFGIRALLLDRSSPNPQPPMVNSLLAVPRLVGG